MTKIIDPEFSFIFDLELLGDDPRVINLTADEAARTALARRFGLVSIEAFEGQVTLSWLKPGRVLSLTGRISASVTQSCVVTLDPVPAVIAEEIDIVFARDTADSADIVDPNEAEPLEGETLDIGEIAAEELSLSLDPYPRRPGIDPATIELGPGASMVNEEDAAKAPKRENPFGILAQIKPKS